jgi:hypothetical protein
MIRPRPLARCAALLALLAAGCGGGQPKRKPVFPVRGELYVNGQPAGGAMVSFVPAGERDNPRAMRSQGKAGADGVFQLTTYDKDDGAPEGDYVVTVYWPGARPARPGGDEEETLPPDRLQLRFATPAGSVLRARVAGKPTRLPRVDLGDRAVTQSREFLIEEK